GRSGAHREAGGARLRRSRLGGPDRSREGPRDAARSVPRRGAPGCRVRRRHAVAGDPPALRQGGDPDARGRRVRPPARHDGHLPGVGGRLPLDVHPRAGRRRHARHGVLRCEPSRPEPPAAAHRDPVRARGGRGDHPTPRPGPRRHRRPRRGHRV
ncbi:MAG: hypothetical protein AVDCRST_MAG47-2049, partial [uncultured Nocardioidaceae bacterium]